MCLALLLSLPNSIKACFVEIYGLGVVLVQEGHPIAFMHKALSFPSLGLSNYERKKR